MSNQTHGMEVRRDGKVSRAGSALSAGTIVTDTLGMVAREGAQRMLQRALELIGNVVDADEARAAVAAAA